MPLNKLSGKHVSKKRTGADVPIWDQVPTVGDVKGPSSSINNTIPKFSGVSGKAITNSQILIDDDDIITYPAAYNVKRVTRAVSANSAGETLIAVTDTSAPRTITLDNDDKEAGRIIIVKDESGGAGSNPITVVPESGTIDGASSVIIGANYGSQTFYSNGTNWFVLGGVMANPIPYKLNAATSSTNATSLKASPGKVYSVSVLNVDNNDFFIKFYDKASAPVVGTDVPVLVLRISRITTDIANGIPTHYTFPEGIYFSTGIAFATTTGILDSNTGVISVTSQCPINISYE